MSINILYRHWNVVNVDIHCFIRIISFYPSTLPPILPPFQIPGWSGLANARVTIFGDVYPLPSEHQEWAQKLYATKHGHGASQQWGNFYFYRMEAISDIYFVGGFGTVAWVDVTEYTTSKPDVIAATNPEGTLMVRRLYHVPVPSAYIECLYRVSILSACIECHSRVPIPSAYTECLYQGPTSSTNIECLYRGASIFY